MKEKCMVCGREVDSDEEFIAWIPFRVYIPLEINDKVLMPDEDGFVCMDTECEVLMEEFKVRGEDGEILYPLTYEYLEKSAQELYDKKYGE